MTTPLLLRSWLAEAERTEPNDPNAIALATVDAAGIARLCAWCLLKEIEGAGTDGAFVFYTNYDSAKGAEIEATGVAAFVHALEIPAPADPGARPGHAASRPTQADQLLQLACACKSRIGAWASRQSRPLESARGTDGRGGATGNQSDGLNPRASSALGGLSHYARSRLSSGPTALFAYTIVFRWSRQ